jgi:hypothetical protein
MIFFVDKRAAMGYSGNRVKPVGPDRGTDQTDEEEDDSWLT